MHLLATDQAERMAIEFFVTALTSFARNRVLLAHKSSLVLPLIDQQRIHNNDYYINFVCWALFSESISCFVVAILCDFFSTALPSAANPKWIKWNCLQFNMCMSTSNNQHDHLLCWLEAFIVAITPSVSMRFSFAFFSSKPFNICSVPCARFRTRIY